MNFFLLTGLLVLGSCQAEVTVTPVAGPFVHGEGPHWEQRSQKLLCVDIDEQKVIKWDVATGQITYAYISNGPTGFIIPAIDSPNMYVVGAGHKLVALSWDSDYNTTEPFRKILTTVEADRNGNRWNDAKADSMGRLWAGTIGDEKDGVVKANQAALYRIDGDINVVVAIPNVTNSNGLAWNGEDDMFYYIDTPTRRIAKYNYESESGTISNMEVAFDLNKTDIPGLPDGMTTDTDGNLWIAMYNGGCVIKVNPQTGEHVETIPIPAKMVTSVTFGGPLMDTIYATTSRRGLTKKELEKQPHAGYIFEIKGLNARGLLSNSFYYNPKP